jgi:hypothetical protein
MAAKKPVSLVDGLSKQYDLLSSWTQTHEKLKQAVADSTSQATEDCRALLASRPPEAPEVQLLGTVLNGLRRARMSLNHWSVQKTVEETRRALDEAAASLARYEEFMKTATKRPKGKRK